MMMNLLLFGITLNLAFLRIVGVTHEAFQAVAHLFVGGLFGAYFVNRTKWYYLFLAVVLSVVELGAFIYFKFINK